MFDNGLKVLEFTIDCKTKVTERAPYQLKVKRFTNQIASSLITARKLALKEYQLDNEVLEEN